jgi:hypothetical protein
MMGSNGPTKARIAEAKRKGTALELAKSERVRRIAFLLSCFASSGNALGNLRERRNIFGASDLCERNNDWLADQKGFEPAIRFSKSAFESGKLDA